MSAILLHIVLLLLLAFPIINAWLSGQPGSHQATAAAWAVGLLMMAGVWAGYMLLSTGLLIWRFRVRRPSLPMVLGLHIVSAAGILMALYLYSSLFG